MKFINWDTGNLPRHAKMSHRLRSMMKMRDRAALDRKTKNVQRKGGAR